MRFFVWFALLFAAANFPAGAFAQEMPREVSKVLDGLVKECRENGGKPGNPNKAVASAELNGDARPDWVIDYGALECEGAPSLYCGTAGCTHDIFVSQGDRYLQVWSSNIHGWRAVKVRGRPGIAFDLHGSACGRSGADPCSKRFVFSGGKLVPTR